MRPKCKCGAIAGWWYCPVIYKKMNYEEYIQAHAYCENCADTENWAEYAYVGFHKKDWRWLNKKKSITALNKWNEYLSQPFYDVSHIKEGNRWHYKRYYSYDKAVEETTHLIDVIIRGGKYE